MQTIASIYSDYLLVTSKQATATGLSSMLEGELSHDQVTRMLKDFRDGDKMLWSAVKSSVRRVERADGILIFDDTVEEKTWMEENEIISWHFDHTKGKSVKGLNQLTALYYCEDEKSQGISIPVSYELVRKTQEKWDAKRGTFKRVSAETKNEMMMRMLRGCVSKKLKFKYIVADKWYASSATMMQIHHDLRKHFVFPLKSNRKIALSLEDKQNARFQSVSELTSRQGESLQVYLEQIDVPLKLYIKHFELDENKEAFLFLVTNDLELEGDGLYQIYQRRWKVEEFYKSVKSNAAYAKSPAHHPKTQEKHIVLCLLAFVKLERLRIKFKKNHFALAALLAVDAAKAAYFKLQDWNKAVGPSRLDLFWAA